MTAITLAAFAGLFSTITAFVGYWAGVGNAERRHRHREAELLDDLDDAVVLLHAATNVRVMPVREASSW